MKPILLSGIKPTGDFHFGNYFGAMKQMIEIANADSHEAYIMIADYHALTSVNDGQKLKEMTRRAAAAFIASGIDVSRVYLFRQSDVPMHAELAMIFGNVVSVPYMMRAHAFKDAESKNKEVNVGTFTYPILMAADILIYKASIVPVGADQKQHVEYARDIAGFFNRAWSSDVFPLPSAMIVPEVGNVLGVDGAKMSKSYGNQIELFCNETELKKRIMSIVTDSKRPEEAKDPDTNNIYNIHSLFLDEASKKALLYRYETPGMSYKEAKDALYYEIIEWRKGRIEKYDELLANDVHLEDILASGAEAANKIAYKTMKEVRGVLGFK